MSYGGSYGGPPPYQGTGGFTSPQNPPRGADPQLWSWFVSIDKDRSGAITLQELQKALVNGDFTPFDLDTVKLLMNIFDVDRSGTIGFNEFAGIWKYIKDWQGVFLHFDRDRSGTIDGNELQAALSQFGYTLSPQLLNLLQRKYGTDRFEECMACLFTLTQPRITRDCLDGGRLPICSARNHF